ncbi:unnamed protein product [Trifolium pratense]|uniref:Uncharacterized protein n=1 Tax=Trifolium pratense TaxID=57577 RepID=A0ACB0IX83_TRIPR|nr:unnamed protein product [Trifolium pratense]
MHKCPERSLRVLILGEGETLNEEGEIVRLEEVEDESDEEEEVECKLMGVLGSMGESHTMKVGGRIQNVELLVLIDSGASHNFISPKVTTALGLAITPTTTRNIKLGDGHKVSTTGMCKGVKMKVGEFEIVVDAFVLELGGMDMVLGVAWLSTLGKVVMDWKAMTMQFSVKDKEVQLQGLCHKLIKQSYLNSYLEDTYRGEMLDLWWSQVNAMETAVDTNIHNEFSCILNKFIEVFKDHIQLPLERSQVHHINLQPGQGAINVRPYRYPHHQKAEIEKQVSELLAVGVIRPSMSSFSSPVILQRC